MKTSTGKPERFFDSSPFTINYPELRSIETADPWGAPDNATFREILWGFLSQN